MAPCSIKWCGKDSRNTNFKTDGITFHRYPKDAELKKKWIQATRRENWFPSEYSVICSRHFTQDCFLKMKNRRRLLCSAVPSRFLPILEEGRDEKIDYIDTRRGLENALTQGLTNDIVVSNFTLEQMTHQLQHCNKVPPAVNQVEADSKKTECTLATPDLKIAEPKTSNSPAARTPEHNKRKRLSDSPSTSLAQSETPKSKKQKTVCESPSKYDTPIKKHLCRRIIELSDKIVQKNRQIKNLRHKTGYLKKRVSSLKSIISELQKKSLVNAENADILSKIGVTSKELIQRQVLKSNKKGCIVRKKYSPELRTFALTLNFYSTKAYKYVRQKFQTCLPSLKTLSKWYQTVDGRPGFTKEAFDALKIKAEQSKDELICTLIFDEMKIKTKVEYHPSTQRIYGYVDFGAAIETDSNHECTEALVLLVVALNGRFKVPIGYFLTNGTNADQKANLVLQAIQLCHESNVTIKALTFDGCPANITMAKKLGCILETENLKTYIKHPTTNANIFVFLDPVHMLKLFRNALECYQEFKNSRGDSIKWNYIKTLQELQDREQFHLANKLRVSHIQFKQNIMKVKLASQVFSRSVATALQFCKNELKLSEFDDVDATAEALLLINDLFDILDSKVHGYGYKRALDLDNAEEVFRKLEECKQFLLTVTSKNKLNRDVKLIKSPRNTAFLGFCVAIESVKHMYTDLINNPDSCIKYIPFHKISQDHIEIFFSVMRSHGGNNDNPTPRLFESIYKKILIHSELNEPTTGNCVPSERISILNCSSAVKRINLTTTTEEEPEVDETDNQEEDNLSIRLSTFAENAIEYIAGYVASTLIKKIQCKTCIGALISLTENKNSLIWYRDLGGLIYPSNTVIKICRRCEIIIKRYNDKQKTTKFLVNKTLSSFLGEQLFEDIKMHQFYTEETNHVVDLSMSVMQKYISTRLAFLIKSANRKPTVRRIFTKLIHFKND